MSEKALRESITHWTRLLNCDSWDEIHNEGIGHESCPLCKIYHESGCAGCPVSESTKEKYCAGTPYSDAGYYAVKKYGTNFDPLKWKYLARKEIEFLKGLI